MKNTVYVKTKILNAFIYFFGAFNLIAVLLISGYALGVQKDEECKVSACTAIGFNIFSHIVSFVFAIITKYSTNPDTLVTLADITYWLNFIICIIFITLGIASLLERSSSQSNGDSSRQYNSVSSRELNSYPPYAKGVLESLTRVGYVTSKKTSQGIFVYYKGALVGNISDNRFLVTQTPTTKRLLSHCKISYPSNTFKIEMYVVEEVNDLDLMKEIFQGIYEDINNEKIL